MATLISPQGVAYEQFWQYENTKHIFFSKKVPKTHTFSTINFLLAHVSSCVEQSQIFILFISRWLYNRLYEVS